LPGRTVEMDNNSKNQTVWQRDNFKSRVFQEARRCQCFRKPADGYAKSHWKDWILYNLHCDNRRNQ